MHKINPAVANKSKWSHEEDMKVISLIKQIGTKWSQIAKALPNRHDNQIKNRYY